MPSTPKKSEFMNLLGIAAGLTVLALASTLLWARFYGSAESGFLICRCTGCRQKLRYPAARAGHSGCCPRCGTCWTFPGRGETRPYELAPINGRKVKVGRKRAPRVFA